MAGSSPAMVVCKGKYARGDEGTVAPARQSRRRSLMDVFERVFSSTRLTMTAQ
jgi:hypothetical protein